jgi:excisionase family DNA binding protein
MLICLLIWNAVSDRLLTAREVSDLLGLSTPSILRRWRSGELPGFRLSSNVLRFRRSEIDAWLEARRGPDSPRRLRAAPARREER